MRDHRLLLDTCALLWLAAGDEALSKDTLDVIDRASIVLVSAISAWEISLKVAREKLQLATPAAEWFVDVLDHHKLLLAPLSIDVLTMANDLPWHHRDPADRFIIATAIQEHATIVTADAKRRAYDVKLLDCHGG